LLFGLSSPGSTVFSSFSRGRSDRLGNELLGIALVASCFAERTDLTLVVVVDSVDRRLRGNRLDSRLVGVAGCSNVDIVENDEIVDSVCDVIKTGKITDIHKLATTLSPPE
jgi:hypothetical protein